MPFPNLKYWKEMTIVPNDDYKVTDITSICVSSKALGELLSVGDRQIRNLAEQGILKRNSHGKYLLAESVKNYILTLKLSKSTDGKINTDYDDETIDLDLEKAKHERIKMQITEIKLQLVKGMVHKSEDVERVITNMFVNFRSKMLALPAKLAPRLEEKKKTDIQEILKLEVTDALNELADYNPAMYYSNEHIDIEDDDVFGIIEEDSGDENA